MASMRVKDIWTEGFISKSLRHRQELFDLGDNTIIQKISLVNINPFKESRSHSLCFFPALPSPFFAFSDDLLKDLFFHFQKVIHFVGR